MKNLPFKSPLKKGQIVRTSDGFTVRVLGEARMYCGEYRILIQVVKAKKDYQQLVGQQFYWGHHKPSTFTAKSKITYINATPISEIHMESKKDCFHFKGSDTSASPKFTKVTSGASS